MLFGVVERVLLEEARGSRTQFSWGSFNWIWDRSESWKTVNCKEKAQITTDHICNNLGAWVILWPGGTNRRVRRMSEHSYPSLYMCTGVHGHTKTNCQLAEVKVRGARMDVGSGEWHSRHSLNITWAWELGREIGTLVPSGPVFLLSFLPQALHTATQPQQVSVPGL